MAHAAPINLWNATGRIGRLRYFTLGLTLFVVKYWMDLMIAWLVFGQSWWPWNYIYPSGIQGLSSPEYDDGMMFGTLLLVSLPFAWVGVVLTIQRLRDVQANPWLAILFFVPLVNLALFAACLLLPGHPPPSVEAQPDKHTKTGSAAHLIPSDPWPAAGLAAGITGTVGLLATALGTEVFGSYGWAIFVALPFCLGLLATVIYGYHERRAFTACVGVSTAAAALCAGLLFIFALEGLICLVMAAPIWYPCTLLGTLIGYGLQTPGPTASNAGRVTTVFVAALPLMLGYEAAIPRVDQPQPVETEIIIDAPPREVWQYVVSFPDLPAPKSWLFSTGVAYPVRARINGTGIGAMRYCEFSTGAFVEPITAWDQPHRLAFDVTSNPPPMREWSIYEDVHPPHLDGFLRSRRGEFRLEALPSGRTRLTGTTWYEHDMWPQFYWRLWSDHIIHEIHGEVLGHIRGLSEGNTP